MGTRHLICVVKDGEYKVAQYGQWDGYPSGQGKSIITFLTKVMNRPLFETKVAALSWITEEEQKAQWKECGAGDSEWVSMEVADKHTEKYPENSRDTGAKLLSLIQNSDRPLKLINSLNFAGDSLFCEWAYVIDLDKNVLEVYTGFNKEPHAGERFSGIKKNEEYYPIKFLKSYDLSNLPTLEEFLALDGDE